MAAWYGRPIRVLIFGAILITGGAPLHAEAQDTVRDLAPYLRGIGLEAKDLESAARGAVVIKLLSAPRSTDAAVFGMTRLRATPDAAVRYFLNFEQPLTAQGRRFAPFGDPPRPADVMGISFDESEYRDLRDCIPGDCHFKLPASGMKLFAQQIDWSSPDAKAQADRRLREGVLRLVREYRQRGDSAMLAYEDRGSIRPHDVFVELAAQMSRWVEYPRELEQHLTAFPAGPADRMRDFFYWAEDRMPRLRPTLTVNHVVQYVSTRSPKAVFLAKKQLYASHYFDGGFEQLAIVDLGREGTWLLTVRSFRFDQLSGGPLNIRGRVQGRLQEALRAELEQQRSAIEQRNSLPIQD